MNLQFITHATERYDCVSGTEAVLRGGCRWVQLRMKGATDEEFVAVGHRVGALCRAAGAKFILDDRVHLVPELDADGVHLGKNDMAVDRAREILGSGRIIGATANSFGDICRAAAAGADYIGLGPFRFTTTKERLSPVLGVEGYREIMAACRREGIVLPVVAIGGITAADAAEIMRAGVSGIALSGALLNAGDTAAECENIIKIINSNLITL